VVREKMNTAVTARDDLERLISLPTLAVIPQAFGAARGGLLAGWRRNGVPAPSPNGNGRHPRPGMEALSRETLDPSIVAALHKSSPGAEAYRRLRTNLLFAQATPLKSLVVTSATPSEGKTTTSTNLSVTYAQQGLKVVLVDCDLRRPRVHHVFGVERSPGLSELILGYAALDAVLLETPVENLTVVPSGTPPPNPAELLGGPRMRELLAELGTRFDVVILDSPPMLLAPESSVLAVHVDGVVLVVRAGATHRGAVRDAAQQVRTVGANLVGGVLNDPAGKLTATGGYGYYAAYQYYGRDHQDD
jgi:capsular exopolysaccharide synthesis family protein